MSLRKTVNFAGSLIRQEGTIGLGGIGKRKICYFSCPIPPLRHTVVKANCLHYSLNSASQRGG